MKTVLNLAKNNMMKPCISQTVDSDTDDDYMLEEDAEDLSDDSDGGISEDEILYSVKRYYLLCICL